MMAGYYFVHYWDKDRSLLRAVVRLNPLLQVCWLELTNCPTRLRLFGYWTHFTSVSSSRPVRFLFCESVSET